MPLTRQSLVDQAMMLALAGVGEANNPLDDDPAVVELLIERAIRKLSERLACKPDYAHLMRDTQDVVFANGEATIPSNILSALFGGAELKRKEPSDLSSRVVQWVRSQAEYEGWQEAGFLYGLRRDNKMYVRDATGNGINETMSLDAATEITDSALSGMPEALSDDLIAQLAACIRDFMEVKA